jgi:hypothetical protein
MGEDMTCSKCDYYRGHPNTFVNKRLVFICSHCKSGYDSTDEKAEARFMGVN